MTMKKIITLILISVMLICAVGCKEETVSEKTFEKDGIRITLTQSFEEKSSEDYTACYQADDMAVFCIKYPKGSFENYDKYSLYDFAGGLRSNKSDRNPTELERYSKYFAFEYTSNNPDDGKDYTYYTAVYKSNGEFWVVQFGFNAENADIYHDNIGKWAGSVEFY